MTSDNHHMNPQPSGRTVAVVGLGYVGTVTAACLARSGFSVVGVDIDESKVAAIHRGAPAFSEPELEPLIAACVADGSLRAETELHPTLLASDVWLVTVGTPSGPDGDADLRAVHRVGQALGRALHEVAEPPLIILTSTVPPGTSEQIIIPTLAEGGLEEGKEFFFAYSPEFLREGNAVADYLRPERTVIGTGSDASRKRALEFFTEMDDEPIIVDIRTAEFAKYTDNTWHALKVAFANEIARVADAQGVDPRAAMELFAKDRRLNISAAYLSPGFAFGGSCLPKDVRTIATRARWSGVEAPVIDAIIRSNDAHIAAAVRAVEALAPTRVGVVGLAFKSGTDDLRESPALPLVRQLVAGGRDVVVYDPLIAPERLHGANALQMMRDLPQQQDLLTDKREALLDCDVVVITQRGAIAREVAAGLDASQTLVDLAGVLRGTDTPARYLGLAW